MANEQLHTKLQEIALTDITDIGSVVPAGQYVCKLTQVNPKPADGDKAGSVEAVYEILDGDFEGLEIRVYYSLSVVKSEKNGKIYAAGISDMKSACASVDRAFSPDFKMSLDPVKAGQAYVKQMTPTKVPRVVVAIWEDEYKDKDSGEMKKTFRKKVVGLPKPGQVSAPSGVQSAAKQNGSNATATAPSGSGTVTNILEQLDLA